MGEYGEVDPYDPSLLNWSVRQDSRVNGAAAGPRFAKEVARAMSSFGYFHLEASSLKSLGTGEPRDRIGYNGEWLPDFIAWTKSRLENADLYDSLLVQCVRFCQN